MYIYISKELDKQSTKHFSYVCLKNSQMFYNWKKKSVNKLKPLRMSDIFIHFNLFFINVLTHTFILWNIPSVSFATWRFVNSKAFLHLFQVTFVFQKKQQQQNKREKRCIDIISRTYPGHEYIDSLLKV